MRVAVLRYKTLVENELKDICKEILGLLNETLVPIHYYRAYVIFNLELTCLCNSRKIPDVENEIKKAKESEDANDKTVKDLQVYVSLAHDILHMQLTWVLLVLRRLSFST